MELEQRLREGLAAPDPGVKFTDGVMTRVRQLPAGRAVDAGARSRKRSSVRNRFILIGAIAVLGVAAAILAILLSGTPHSPAPVVTGTSPREPAAQPVAPPAEAPAAAPATPPPMAHEGAKLRYTVAVLPLRHESQNPAGRALLETFRAALLDGLRKVPGLTLVYQEAVDPADEQAADYLLTVASIAETVLPSGLTMASSADGKSVTGSRSASGQMQAEVIVQPTREQPRPAPYDKMFALADPDSPEQRRFCEQVPEPLRDRFCLAMAERVAMQVEALRSYVFPPDPSWQQGLVARLRDMSRSQSERGDAMWALLNMQGRGLRLDAAAIGSIVEYVVAMPQDQRKNANVWRRLPLATDAGFVPPLLDVMRQHPDAQVRLEALMALTANRDEDPRVRAALGEVAQQDSSPTMRMAVHRALSGEAEWNGYVVTTLNNAELSIAQRLEPLQTSAQWAASADAAGVTPLVKDRQVANLLLGMAREGIAAPVQVETTGQVLELLKDVEDPAVADLFLGIMQDDKFGAAKSRYIFTVTSWMSRHENDPRVRKILDEGAARSGIPRGFLTVPR